MKNWVLRASTAALALAAGASIGCSTGGCGGTNVNANDASSSAPISMQCGRGTYLNKQNQCVPLSSNSTSTSAQPQAAPVKYISN